MFALLLGLRSPTCRVRNVNAVLGHDRETRQSGLGRLGSILLRLLRDTHPSIAGWRSHADGAVCRITEGGRGSRRWGVDGRETGGHGLGWALLESIACPGRGEDIICSGEGTSVEVDGGIVITSCKVSKASLLTGSRSLYKSRVTSENLSCLRAEPVTKVSINSSSSLVPRAGWNCRGAPKKGWVMVKEVDGLVDAIAIEFRW